jgi:hypothetical protein
MRLGEVAVFVLHPDKGYKASGSGGSIPANAVLKFEIELYTWDGGDGEQPAQPMPEKEEAALPAAASASKDVRGLRQRKRGDGGGGLGVADAEDPDAVQQPHKPQSVAGTVAFWLPKLLFWFLVLMLLASAVLYFLGEFG